MSDKIKHKLTSYLRNHTSGAVDLQDFVNVGSDQTASNSNLEGQLQHNTTYYVTVKCINGAGLETVVESDGR